MPMMKCASRRSVIDDVSAMRTRAVGPSPRVGRTVIVSGVRSARLKAGHLLETVILPQLVDEHLVSFRSRSLPPCGFWPAAPFQRLFDLAPFDLDRRAADASGNVPQRSIWSHPAGRRVGTVAASERLRLLAWIVSCSHRMAARSIQFCRSRTLPGHGYGTMPRSPARQLECGLGQFARELLDK